jgi:multidrug efflux pump subunit AcrA (membrane-fusion protein)
MTSTDSPSPAPRPVQPRKPAARRRWLPWLGAVVLVAAIALGLRPQPIPVEIGKVSEGTLRATVNEEGRTRIRQRYTVYAPVAGQLRRLPFKAGATVRAGETVVAVLDPLPSSLLDARSRILAEARRDTAAAQLAKAREALRFAALELQRFQKLYADRTVSAQELEGVQWREAAATKEATAAESALRQAEAELAEFEANPASVAAGVPPAVEGGVSPPGVLDSVTPDHPNLPPGKMPGSTAGETPAATNSDIPPVSEPTKRPPSSNPPVEVRAPISGQVLRVPEESARVVTPGTRCSNSAIPPISKS